MAIIYHVTSSSEWEAAKAKGYYEAPSLATEGFIHCSQDHQVEGVLQRYFSGRTDLVKLVIDTEKLNVPLRYELAPSVGESFPHLYGPLNLEAVEGVEAIGG
jgi:uncharacterized protein (DUF952 family)